MTAREIPDPATVFPLRVMAERHPQLFTIAKLQWIARNRATNGAAASGAVFKAANGEMLFAEPALLRHWFGLSGRATPRASRKRRAGA